MAGWTHFSGLSQAGGLCSVPQCLVGLFLPLCLPGQPQGTVSHLEVLYLLANGSQTV
jgi:hypothetical protein